VRAARRTFHRLGTLRPEAVDRRAATRVTFAAHCRKHGRTPSSAWAFLSSSWPGGVPTVAEVTSAACVVGATVAPDLIAAARMFLAIDAAFVEADA